MSYASFHGKRIRHPVLSRRAMYYSRNIRHFHRSAHQDLRRYPIPHLRTRRTSPLQRTYPLLISAQNVIRPGRSGNPPDSYPTTACAVAGIRSRIGRVRRHPHRPHAVARPHGPGHPYLVRGVVRRRPPPFSFASTRCPSHGVGEPFGGLFQCGGVIVLVRRVSGVVEFGSEIDAWPGVVGPVRGILVERVGLFDAWFSFSRASASCLAFA